MENINKKNLSVLISLTALNLIIGSIVSFFKLPIYLDSIGIVLATILIDWRYGLICSLITVLGGFLLINPYLPFYTLTSFAIVFTVNLLRKWNFLSTLWKVILSGIIIAIVSAVISAPITTYLFEGSTLSGNDAITAYFISTGKTILNSVVLSGISSELVDKIAVVLISFIILKSIPISFFKKNHFRYYKEINESI
jgi:energy-coupling factor transport system substrate-specific component